MKDTSIPCDDRVEDLRRLVGVRGEEGIWEASGFDQSQLEVEVQIVVADFCNEILLLVLNAAVVLALTFLCSGYLSFSNPDRTTSPCQTMESGDNRFDEGSTQPSSSESWA